MIPLRSAFEILTAKLNTVQHAVACVTDRYSYTAIAVALGATYLLGAVSYAVFLSPLRNIPGSLIRRLTLLKYYMDVVRGIEAEKTESNYRRYGDIYLLGPNHVAICNPADCQCKRVLGTHNFKKSDIYQAFAIVGDSIFTTQSADVSSARRRLLGPAFTHGYLSRMEPTILECGIVSLKRKWDKMLSEPGADGKVVVEYSRQFSLAAFDVISTLMYGQRFNSLGDFKISHVRWIEAFTTLGLLKFAMPFVSRFPGSLLVQGLIGRVRDFTRFTDGATERRRKLLHEMKEGEDRPNDILQALIDAEDPETGARLTATEMTSESTLMLIAGTHTTSPTLAWTLHYLLLYPEVYRKAVQEVRSTFLRHHLIRYTEGRSKLPYLEACLYESMRIRSIAGLFMPRVVPKGGATFQGHYLPEGTQIGLSIAGMNHHLGTWENPQTFRPERFLEDRTAKHRMLSFSTGVRICPSRNLAWVEMIPVLANLLKDYDMELPEDSLFKPSRLDGNGNPVVMPRLQTLTVAPKCQERDCRVVISAAPDY
ncbi:putative cytochrome P450 monooxygenase [Martensiomyces pterosporus]|nr:putative cytochrome P450 monooxygenase [Martensiomyces pterosporus]